MLVYFNAIDFNDIMVIFDINISKPLAQGFLTGCIPGSACVGAFLCRFLLNKFSRKQCLNIVNILCISGILLIQTKYFPFLIIGRILQGFVVGIGTTVIPLYIK